MPLFYKIAYLILLNHWYVFRPASRGVHCLITRNRQVLLIRHTYGLGYWELPGGGYLKNETAKSAIAREVKEEVGLTPIKFNYLGQYITLHEYKKDHVEAFHAPVKNFKFELTSPEIQSAKWFPLKKLPPHLSPHVQNTLRLYSKSVKI